MFKWPGFGFAILHRVLQYCNIIFESQSVLIPPEFLHHANLYYALAFTVYTEYLRPSWQKIEIVGYFPRRFWHKSVFVSVNAD